MLLGVFSFYVPISPNEVVGPVPASTAWISVERKTMPVYLNDRNYLDVVNIGILRGTTDK